MTKDVLVTIKGVQFFDEENSDVEMVVRGYYYQKDGKHYIIYDEQIEGFEGTVRNILKVSSDSMEIIKKGVASTHMRFEKNKKNLSCYNTPLGSLIVGISATRICVQEGKDALKIQVAYQLEINYQYVSDCSIKVEIQSVSGAGSGFSDIQEA